MHYRNFLKMKRFLIQVYKGFQDISKIYKYLLKYFIKIHNNKFNTARV